MTKRNKESGEFMDVKKTDSKFIGVRKEKGGDDDIPKESKTYA